MLDLGDIIASVTGLGGFLVAGLLWVGQQKGKANEQDRRLSAIEAAIAGQASYEAHIARLEERISAQGAQLSRLPELIAICVGTAIKEALRFNAARAA